MGEKLPVDEYHELCENMRHYGNMRFAQLTLFTALTAGLLGAAASPPDDMPWLRLLLAVAGAVSALAFWVMELRSSEYWRSFHDRAKELEEGLGYKQFRSGPGRPSGGLSASRAVGALYWLAVAMWLVILYAQLR